ncbi:unnamed protein product, partial [Polarella glacialis]
SGSQDEAPEPRAPKYSTFADERWLWLQALTGFFGRRAELQHLGPLIWRFLDDRPQVLRLALADGRVFELAMREIVALGGGDCRRPVVVSSADKRHWDVLLPFAARALGFHNTQLVGAASADGDVFVYDLPELDDSTLFGEKARLQSPRSSRDTLAAPRRLAGHQEPVLCFAGLVGGDFGSAPLLATGSADTTVRLWRGSHCVQVYESQEWSDWTGTMYLGHTAPVTAICITSDELPVSGDSFGAVCMWRADGMCDMLDPAHDSPVTCLEAGPEDHLLIVGHGDGEIRLVERSGRKRVLGAWREARGGAVLAARGLGVEPLEVLAVSPSRLLAARVGDAAAAGVGSFPAKAFGACFDGDFVLAFCGETAVLMTLDGNLRAVVSVSLSVSICAGRLMAATKDVDQVRKDDRRNNSLG